MTDAQTPTGHTSDVYIHMQRYEDEAVADCGCRLVMDSLGTMMFFQCPLHKAAPDQLEACKRALRHFDTSDTVNNTEDNAILCDMEAAIIKAAVKK